jgi:hypothetical protein
MGGWTGVALSLDGPTIACGRSRGGPDLHEALAKRGE